MEALGLLLTVLADTSSKQKRSSYADELARYLVVHASTDDVSSTTHYPSFYDEHSRHTVLHSEYRVGMALHKLNIVALGIGNLSFLHGADAILLEAFVIADPENPLIPNLVKGLMAKRRDGIWKNTQENCWALVSLDRYFTGRIFFYFFFIPPSLPFCVTQ